MKTVMRILFVVVFISAVMAPIPTAVFAQDEVPGCGQGTVVEGCPPPESSEGMITADATASFKHAYTKILKGGYVAHGVGMRNTGFGTISVRDVPAGATVAKAYLFWSVIGLPGFQGYLFHTGKINGVNIAGALVGVAQSPCWSVSGLGTPPIWAYRADVTSKMAKGGNGTYNLSGFASGITNGSDPWSTTAIGPLMEGATLVIVFSKSTYPLTTVKIFNGAATTPTQFEQLHVNMTGMNALGLPGLSKTTFIGADGQDAEEVGSHFFVEDLDVSWDGQSVPNGAGFTYSQGNLWDTETRDLSALVDPPEPEFWFSTQGSNDCLTWVAQVASYANGNQDSDGDKLKDNWELHGVNGVPLQTYGADPLHKDLFIEADYMTGHDHLIDATHLQDIVNVFANAPVSNPDGFSGINMHIDTGGAAFGQPANTFPQFDMDGGNGVTEDANLGTMDPSGDYNWTEFQAVKDANFSPSREGIFHYMVFAHNLAVQFGSTSGISRNGWPDSAFIKGATDFIVSMGGWGGMGSQAEREGTFTHELGHNLGLRHGGNDHNNYKPNYLSVMNYYYQTWGVYRGGGWENFDYSRFATPALNESSLNEFSGIGAIAAGYGARYWCPALGDTWTSSNAPIDWNCNGVTSSPVAVDINKSGGFSTLSNQNNWAAITFGGGGVIGTGVAAGLPPVNALVSTRPTMCLTEEVNLQMNGAMQHEP